MMKIMNKKNIIKKTNIITLDRYRPFKNRPISSKEDEEQGDREDRGARRQHKRPQHQRKDARQHNPTIQSLESQTRHPAAAPPAC